MKNKIKDIKLADKGKERMDWAAKQMSVLEKISIEFEETKPLKGKTIGACLHITTETGNLAIALKKAGANVYLCASNPLSTQDDVAASLVKHHDISVFGIKHENNKEYYLNIENVIKANPEIIIDDGADLISTIHKSHKKNLPNILGGIEETTTGVIRLKAMEEKKDLKFPIIAVNDSKTKHLFDNRYGTGQSTLDGIIRASNRLIAGTTFVVCGYGWCGKGIAKRAKGMGASVIITEIDPIKALEAKMEGFRVLPIREAAKVADFICTVTGNINVVNEKALDSMNSECIVCNAGHFNVEINLDYLKSISTKTEKIREYIHKYTTKDKRVIYVLAEGRLVNLAAAEGHPSSVMDMSFANQALAAKHIVENQKNLESKVYTMPQKIDSNIAKLKLSSLGVKYDKLSPEQKKYMSSWESGT